MERTTSPVWWKVIGVAAVIAIAASGVSALADPGTPKATSAVHDVERAPGQPVPASNHAIDLQNLSTAFDEVLAEGTAEDANSDPLILVGPLSVGRVVELDTQQSASESTGVAEKSKSAPTPAATVAQDRGPRIPTRRVWGESSDLAGRGMAWYRGPLASLGAVLVLILGAAFVVRRFSGRGPVGKGSAIEVLSRTPLGVKQTVALIHVGRRMLLLGISGDRLTPLWNIDDPEEVAHIRGQLTRTSTESLKANFDAALAEESGRHRSLPVEVELDPREHADPARRTQHHLSALVDKLRLRHRALAEQDCAAAREVPPVTAKTER